MLVTDRNRTRGRDLASVVADAVRGGVGMVQVREKDLTDDALRSLVRRIRNALPRPIPLLINDRPGIARTLGVGLHLPSSATLPSSRAAYPYLGRSVHGDDEVAAAAGERLSYLILGTIFGTPSKPGLRGAGIRRVERVAAALGSVPLFAIGGMTVTRVPRVIHAGAYGVAVSGAVLGANDPGRQAQALSLAIEVALAQEASGSRRRNVPAMGSLFEEPPPARQHRRRGTERRESRGGSRRRNPRAGGRTRSR